MNTQKNPVEQDEREVRLVELLQSIFLHLEEAKELKLSLDKDWGATEHFYRFYHQSSKTYKSQETTQKCVELFQKIAGDKFTLNKWFLQIVNDGSGHVFDLDHNDVWLTHTRPQIEAMLHAKLFLDMIVKYGDKMKHCQFPMAFIDYGFGLVLYLFNER